MAFTSDYTQPEPTRAAIDAIVGPLVLEFGAPWCGHCIAVQPTLADLLAQFSDVRHIKIYDGKGKPLGRSFRVKLWPTLVFLRDGQVVGQVARPDKAQILEAIEKLSTKDTKPHESNSS